MHLVNVKVNEERRRGETEKTTDERGSGKCVSGDANITTEVTKVRGIICLIRLAFFLPAVSSEYSEHGEHTHTYRNTHTHTHTHTETRGKEEKDFHLVSPQSSREEGVNLNPVNCAQTEVRGL